MAEAEGSGGVGLQVFFGGVGGEGWVDLEEVEDFGEELGGASVFVEPEADLGGGEVVAEALELVGVEA